MTGNTNKVRAVFLAALMVFSVFAGTVAFSGSAAANAAPTYAGNAVHYADGSSSTAVIEVPFEGGPVDIGTVNESTFTLLDDGDNITDEVVTGYTTRAGPATDNSTVIIQLNDTVPSNDLEVDIRDDVASPATGGAITNPGEKSVVFAGQTLEFDPAQSDSPDNVTAYQGVTIAVNASNGTSSAPANDLPVTVEDNEDNINYFQEGSTGINSTVFTFNTADRELGEYKIFVNGSDTAGARTYVNIRDLELDLEVDDLNVTTDDTIETTTSAVAGGRNVEVNLLDSGGDEINTTGATLDGQGEADVDFETSSADEGETLDTGTYTVEVIDNATGNTIESSEITVSEADDEEANFADNTISDERGDILEVTVEYTETDEATLSFGSEDDGVIANATLLDDDGDGETTVYINTYRVESGVGGDVFNLDSDSDDEITDQALTTTTGDLIDAGDYDLEVQARDLGVTGTTVDDSDDVATVTLQPRGTEEFRTWTIPDSVGTPSDLEDISETIEDGDLTQTSTVANDDIVVHELRTTGFEGVLNAREDEDVTQAFLTNADDSGFYNLTVAEASPGANQDAKTVELGTNNATVVADGPNDTYYVAFDTNNVNYFDGTSIEDDTALEANFTVINNDDSGADFVNEDEYDSDEDEETFVEYDVVEPEITVDTPYNVSQASGQTVSGTTTLAPGTELNLRVRSQDGVSPSFLKTASPDVQSDRTFSATFDFSDQNVGDEYDIIVKGGAADDADEEGTVLESVSTDTATPEPDTDTATPEPDTDTATDTATPEPDTDTPTSTPTSTPGFGVIVALTALLAAALLAVRRDN